MLNRYLFPIAIPVIIVLLLVALAPAQEAVRTPVYASPQAIMTAPTPVVATDPYGFGPWLNAQRARAGLHPLAHDAGLSADAARNSAFGFGHAFLGSARRQNAGMGAGAQVWPMWMASPAHRAALLDPSATRYGIAANGAVWTFNAR